MLKIDIPIPVTIVAGFLGSGKTTLLNRILNGDHGRRIAVMVNDFGAINIDSQLIVSAEQNVVSLANGCICCTVESDLIEQLDTLLHLDEGPPEHILIETSGVSDPMRVVHTLGYPRFQGRLGIDAVIAILDAEHFSGLEGDMEQLAMDQITAGDIVIINKTDLASQSQIQELKERWLFPDARVYETQFADVPLPLLVGVGHSEDKANSSEKGDGHRPAEDHHDRLFSTFSWEGKHALSLSRLRQVLRALPTNIYRAKGVVNLKEAPEQRCIVHLVGTRLEIKKGSIWGNEQPSNQLVMIGWGDFDEAGLRSALNKCVA